MQIMFYIVGQWSHILPFLYLPFQEMNHRAVCQLNLSLLQASYLNKSSQLSRMVLSWAAFRKWVSISSAGCPVILVHCLLFQGAQHWAQHWLHWAASFSLLYGVFSVTFQSHVAYSFCSLAWPDWQQSLHHSLGRWTEIWIVHQAETGRSLLFLQMSTLQRSLPSTVDSCFPTSNIPCAGYSTVFLLQGPREFSFTQHWLLAPQPDKPRAKIGLRYRSNVSTFHPAPARPAGFLPAMQRWGRALARKWKMMFIFSGRWQQGY